MTEPSNERIAAALALAEAVDAYDTKATEETAKAHQVTLAAYRATAPKLRTRAEVDAERLRNLDSFRANALSVTELCMRDSVLCAEPTADPTEPTQPEPDPEACSCDEALMLRARIERACSMIRSRWPMSLGELAAILEGDS